MLNRKGALDDRSRQLRPGPVGVSGALGGDKDEACSQAGIDEIAASLK